MNDIVKVIEEARNEVLPFDSWERLTGERSEAYAAFCVFRDYGLDRTIKKAVDSVEKDEVVRNKKYRTWRTYACDFHWNERVEDFDRYREKLKQNEFRKTIEAQGEKHREITGKMLDVVGKKLDTMNPADLPTGTVAEWVQTAVKSEREMIGIVAPNSKPENKQGEFNFVSDFQGL